MNFKKITFENGDIVKIFADDQNTVNNITNRILSMEAVSIYSDAVIIATKQNDCVCCRKKENGKF